MVESLKQIKNRIRSVGNTQKVTHAMEMISAAKLRPLENRLPAQGAYFLSIEKLLKKLMPCQGSTVHPLVAEHQEKKKTAFCVIASDAGLCGMYNNNLLRLADAFMNQRGKDNILLTCVGKKALNHFKKKEASIREKFVELNGHYSDEICDRILNTLVDAYVSGQAGEVYIAYTSFVSPVRHKPVIEKILNITMPADEDNTGYLFEPDVKSILDELIPAYLSYKMKSAILNSFASEQAARMVAMGEATKNADELLDDLVLSRNKLRQYNITKELLEIISSAEVLR